MFLIRAPLNVSGSVVGVVSHVLHEKIELHPLHNWTKARRTLDTRTEKFCPQHPIYYRNRTGIRPRCPQHTDSIGPRCLCPCDGTLTPCCAWRAHEDPRTCSSRHPQVRLPQVVILCWSPNAIPNSTLATPKFPRNPPHK